MNVDIKTEKKIEDFIRKHKFIYFSEVRALQKKKKGINLIPKVNFDSLQFILKKLEKENKIVIKYLGTMKTITWVEKCQQ